MAKNREYELTYILTPEADEATTTTVATRVNAIITEQFGGEIRRIDDWGTRKLSYKMRKQVRGQYVHLRFTAPGETILELERILRLLDPVLKFLTVRLETESDDTGISPDSSEEMGRQAEQQDDNSSND